MDEDRTPLEAGLGFCVKLDKGEFIGRDVLAAQKRDGLSSRLAAIRCDAEGDDPVLRDLAQRQRDRRLFKSMRLHPDDEYVFLEINPAGQWLFVEQATGQPIAASIARILVENDAS